MCIHMEIYRAIWTHEYEFGSMHIVLETYVFMRSCLDLSVLSALSAAVCSCLQIPYEFSRKLMQLAAAVLTGNSVLDSVLTAVNRLLKKIGCYCSSGCLL